MHNNRIEYFLIILFIFSTSKPVWFPFLCDFYAEHIKEWSIIEFAYFSSSFPFLSCMIFSFSLLFLKKLTVSLTLCLCELWCCASKNASEKYLGLFETNFIYSSIDLILIDVHYEKAWLIPTFFNGNIFRTGIPLVLTDKTLQLHSFPFFSQSLISVPSH